MGLFNKDKKKGEEIPELPELPKLPELPELDDLRNLPQLPSFPRNSIGERFSQSTIKDAISGEKEEDMEGEEDMQMMQKPVKGKFMPQQAAKSAEEDEYGQFQKFERRVLEAPSFSSGYVKRTEPIFVRLDKFEESLKTFEKIRGQISEIENVLREIKKIKEQEERELQFWEQEIQNIKRQIEKVDKDIFSRVE